MSYFLAPALAQLRDQVNAAYPSRDKASDGWIGDASHAAGVSDHNPDYSARGIVRALDIDADLRGTPDSWALAQRLIADRRVRYVIHRGRIWSNPAVYGPSAGSWHTYNGSNPHNTHLHVSVRHGAAWDHDNAPWEIEEDMQLDDKVKLSGISQAILGGGKSMSVNGALMYGAASLFVARRNATQLEALTAAVRTLATSQGLDPDVIQASIDQAVKEALAGLSITLTTEED